MDLCALDAEMHLRHGDPRPAAKWIEDGGELTPYMREHVAAVLRGDPAGAPGVKRTWAQINEEMRVLGVLGYVREFDSNFKTKKAARDYVAGLYGISPETLKKYEARAKKRKGTN